MSKLKGRIKAFTLIESLISIVIIMSVFFIGMMIMVNVIKADKHHQRLKANMLINQVYINTLADKTFSNESFAQDNLTIEKQIHSCPFAEHLLTLIISVKDGRGKVISGRKEIVLTGCR